MTLAESKNSNFKDNFYRLIADISDSVSDRVTFGLTVSTCRSCPIRSTLLMTTSFSAFKTNTYHVLKPYLHHHIDNPYQLRIRCHNMTLINKTKFPEDTDFIIRMLYKYS